MIRMIYKVKLCTNIASFHTNKYILSFQQFEIMTVAMIKYFPNNHKCTTSHYIMPNQNNWLLSYVSNTTHDFWALIQDKDVILPV